jgi:mycoredoxin
MESSNPKTIIIYGTSWCGDTRRTRSYFARNNIEYQWVDIDYDGSGRAIVEKINHGNRSVPTIVFPDGDILVEPSEEQLNRKFSISD